MFTVQIQEEGDTVRAETPTLEAAFGFITDFFGACHYPIGLWRWHTDRWIMDVQDWEELWCPPAPVYARVIAPVGYTPAPNTALERTPTGDDARFAGGVRPRQ